MTKLYTEHQVKQAIGRVAYEINGYYEKTQEPVIAVAAMNGGIFFYVDLVRHFTFPVEMGVISTSHYPNGLPGNAEVELKYIDAKVLNKNVLLVDEICFTGKSLQKMKDIFIAQGAKDVKTAVLVDQKKSAEIHTPDWSAIEYEGDGWLYGYGMDIDGMHRNIPELRIKDE